MPLRLPHGYENPFADTDVPVIEHSRADTQKIRPLRIGIWNLMPSAVRQRSEQEQLRLLGYGSGALQIEPVLLRGDHHDPSRDNRLTAFYSTFAEEFARHFPSKSYFLRKCHC